MPSPQRQPLLQFGTTGTTDEKAKARASLSAVCASGNNLWLACDEGTCLERLTRTAPGTYEQHVRFDLSRFLDLPVKKGEIDIEGLDFDGGCLWLVGSHSLKRNTPKRKGATAKDIRRIAEIETDGNRYLLARIPLAKEGGNFALRAKQGALRAAQLPGDERGNLLVEELREDDHIGPFAPREVKVNGKKCQTGVPSKENGLDIEGLAVSGDRMFVGMRGPVLRGWAVVLELQVVDGAKGRLKLKRIGPKGQRYRKHFLELDGLGVREVAIDGEDLLILAGPTMGLDGPVAVYRWRGALDGQSESLVPRDALTKVLEVPYGTGCDHAEGVVLLSGTASSRPEVLIVYDSPAATRLDGDFGVRADAFELS